MGAVVVLAGGKSRRMGRDKLELALGVQTLLESVINRFKEEFDDVFLSIADIKKYPDIEARRLVDILPGAGPMSGLHAALKLLPEEGVFVVAADLPYACPKTAKRLIEFCGEKEACIIRLPDGKLEPLFGYYRKSLLPKCEEAIKSGDYRLSKIIFGADTLFVAPHELGALWDERLIMNINHPEDYEKVRSEDRKGVWGRD